MNCDLRNFFFFLLSSFGLFFFFFPFLPFAGQNLIASEPANSLIQAHSNNTEAKAIIIGAGIADTRPAQYAESNLLEAYNTFLKKGYRQDQIRFLSAQNPVPTEPNQIPEALSNTLEQVEAAFSWASDASELYVYVAGQGNFNGVILQDQQLTPTALAEMLNSVQSHIPGTITVFIDTHFSAAWLFDLKLPETFFDENGDATKNRVFISGTGAQEVAYWLTADVPGFGDYFWQEIGRGESVGQAINTARQAVKDMDIFQLPALDDNNNGIANESGNQSQGDGLFVEELKPGNDAFNFNTGPVINDHYSEIWVTDDSPVPVLVTSITSDFPLTSVKALVFGPHAFGAIPHITSVTMMPDETGQYHYAFDDLEYGGKYSVVIIATDDQGLRSKPAQFTLVQTVFPDVYEVDDTMQLARRYQPDFTGFEKHTLHDDNDEDWFYFDVRPQQAGDRVLSHRITVGSADSTLPGVLDDSVGAAIDPTITVFDENGERIFGPEDDGYFGEGESLTKIYEPGRYFVRIANYQDDSGFEPDGEERHYTFDITTDEGDGPGEVSGIIVNQSGNLIPDVDLVTSLGVVATSGKWGNFGFSHPAGVYQIFIDYQNITNSFNFSLMQSGDIALQLVVDSEGCTVVAAPPGSEAEDPETNPSDALVRSVFSDFDGDGKADVAVRRPSATIQYIQNSGDDLIQRVRFGRSIEDIPVSGDFDGDGIADVAVRRPDEGMWFVKNSSGVDPKDCNQDGITRLKFGLAAEDIPVPADYDGDGITDFAVRRPSTRQWFVKNSSNIDPIDGNTDGITRIRFGNETDDIPVPADYDGDGKADFAVRRPATHIWYIRNSSGADPVTGNSDGITRKAFGLNSQDLPVPADFDGDGRADLAVRRPGNQTWYVLNSNGEDQLTGNKDGISRLKFGLNPNDIPVPADYDGDGKADIAVRRAGNQTWYIANSTGKAESSPDHIQRIRFGLQSLDIPLSAPGWLKMRLANGTFDLSRIFRD